MPLWQLFIPENAYTAQEKNDLANAITDTYSSQESLKARLPTASRRQ